MKQTIFILLLAAAAFSSCTHKSHSLDVKPTDTIVAPTIWHLLDVPESFSYSTDSLQLLNGSTYAYQRINGDTVLLIGSPQYYVLHIYANGDSMHVCNRFSWQESWEYTYPGFKCYRLK